MDRAFRDLLAFERACGHEPSMFPPGEQVSQHTRDLRVKLIREECGELLEALDAHDPYGPACGALAGIADGIADLIYVAIGTAVRYGIDLPAVWRAVHDANMTKTNGPRRPDGKRLKPDGFRHPDVAGLLAEQPPLGELYGVS